jgi:hypothetical protein
MNCQKNGKSDKIDFRLTSVRRDNGSHLILTKRITLQEEMVGDSKMAARGRKQKASLLW